MLSFCSDAAKESLDQQEAAAAKKELEANYQQVITNLTETKEELKAQNEALNADLKQVSGNAARAANPIKDLTFSFVYAVPRDPRLEDYWKRLEAERANFTSVKFPQGVSWSYVGTEVRIDRKSPLFPQSTELAYELVTTPLTLAFYRAPWNAREPGRRPDLSCDLTRRGEYSDGRSELWYNLKTGKLQVANFKISKYFMSNNGKLTAIPELAGAGLKISFVNQHLSGDASDRVADLNDLRKSILFENLDLSMAGGLVIRIDGRDLQKPAGAAHYEYTFPSNLE